MLLGADCRVRTRLFSSSQTCSSGLRLGLMEVVRYNPSTVCGRALSCFKMKSSPARGPYGITCCSRMSTTKPTPKHNRPTSKGSLADIQASENLSPSRRQVPIKLAPIKTKRFYSGLVCKKYNGSQ
ncbi:hypothetical protein J6590_051075 [Homalodisca vitripennis]|nr:hypothetical protein J6590_051075 [Homalodisca vitripennis]